MPHGKDHKDDKKAEAKATAAEEPQKGKKKGAEEEEAPLRYFQVRIGKVPFGGRFYNAGEVIATTQDLAKERPGKFREVEAPPPRRTAGPPPRR